MKSILLIEEGSDTRTFLRNQLKNEGYHVSAARDWRSAGRLAARIPPDCIVVDIEHLDTGGLGALRRILANRPKARLVLTSARHDKGEEFNSWSSPAHFVKVADLDALKDTVHKALKNGHST